MIPIEFQIMRIIHFFIILLPGIQVNVVNSYAATSDFVVVIVDNNVDFPTLGKPIKHTLAFPYRETSNPSAKSQDILFIWDIY